MDRDLFEVNSTTQPLQKMRVFNNWDVVSKGWYAVCKSNDIKKSKTITKRICGQQLVLFRTEAGQVRALDAYCPHMGLNLALGKVEGDAIRCKFHAWKFDADGVCVDIPCKETSPRNARTEAYAVEEQYGYVWVYPDTSSPFPVFVPHALRGKRLMYYQMKPLNRACHPHVPMLNGVDTQHFKVVHGIDVTTQIEVKEHADNCIEFYLSNEINAKDGSGKWFSKIFGKHYGYSNVYTDGTIALLNTVKQTKLFGRYALPELYLILSLRYTEPGKSEIYPIAVSEFRSGLFGRILSYILIQITHIGFLKLASDEGEEFFKQIRYRSDGLLPVHDKSIAQIIAYTNRLCVSKWSRIKKSST